MTLLIHYGTVLATEITAMAEVGMSSLSSLCLSQLVRVPKHFGSLRPEGVVTAKLAPRKPPGQGLYATGISK